MTLATNPSKKENPAAHKRTASTTVAAATAADLRFAARDPVPVARLDCVAVTRDSDRGLPDRTLHRVATAHE